MNKYKIAIGETITTIITGNEGLKAIIEILDGLNIASEIYKVEGSGFVLEVKILPINKVQILKP